MGDLARRGCTSVLALALLAGCASRDTTVDPAQHVEPPPQWKSASASASDEVVDLTQFWQQFDDPQLASFIADALAHNTGLRSAQAALAQARARRDRARAGWFPSLDAGVAARESRSGGVASERYSASLDAGWEADLFGATARTVDAASAELGASTATRDGVQLALAAEVALAYVEVRTNQLRLDIAQRSLAAQEETLALAGWRAQAGLASELDVAQARTAREQTRAQQATRDTALATARHRLAVLTGRPPAALDELLATTRPVPRARGMLAAGIPAEVLRRRPDVRAAEQRLLAESARLRATRAARYPSLNLGGALGVESLTASGLTGSGTTTRSLLASLSVPLLDGGRRRADIAVQLAVREQTLAAYEAALLGALQDVENALVARHGAAQRIEALRAAAEAAETATVLARHRYAAGSIDFAVLLDSERTLLSVQDSLAVTIADETSAVISLYKALGGGWTPDPRPATTTQEQTP